MNDRIRKTLAASVLALALTSSAFAGVIHTPRSDDPPPPETSGEMQTGATEGDMQNGITTNGIIQNGAVESDATWLAILLSLLSQF